MKVYAYSQRIGLDFLTPEERSEPSPGLCDVVLRMRAVALNHRDLAIARRQYHVAVEEPLIPVFDGAGEVIAVGLDVTRVRIGELACPTYLPDWIDGPATPEKVRRRLGGPNDGVLAELVCVHQEAVVRAPAHLEALEAACLPVTAVTAWHCLFEHGSLRPGETVVVLGAGGVSTAAMQYAQSAGARVIAVTRRDTWVGRLQSIGASDVIVDDSKDWPKRVIELTGGMGADVVVDVMGAHSLGCSIAAIRHGGQVHLVGYAAGTETRFDIFEAIRRDPTIRIATAGSRQSFEALVRVMEGQKLRPAFDRTFAASDFRFAFDYLGRGGHFGKVTLTF